MDRKKITIVALAGIILIGIISLIVMETKKVNDNKTGKNQKVNNIKAVQDAKIPKEDTLNFVGSIETISEKSMSIKRLQDVVVVNIDGATQVEIVNADGKKQEAGRVTDLKVGNLVKVTYGKITRNAKMVTIARPQSMGKTK